MRWTQGSRFLLGCLVFFFGGCTDDIPVVSENFVNAYVELRVVSREYGETSPDSRIARTEVLKKYGYTKESFDSAAMNIKQTPDLWSPFQKKVIERLDSLSRFYEKQKGNKTAERKVERQEKKGTPQKLQEKFSRPHSLRKEKKP
jgi:hypothetical protein